MSIEPAAQDPARASDRPPTGSAAEVFVAFLKLGLTSFGGPVAHLGYFRDELIVRRRWTTEGTYADLVALCQFLPGPASSQIGFALGLLRAGWRGAFAAWTGFTLPSALLLLAFAHGATVVTGPYAQTIIHGLKLVAVAIVAHAVVGMARSLTPDVKRGLIAVASVALILLIGGAFGQIAAIILGGTLGLAFCRSGPAMTDGHFHFGVSKRTGFISLLAFGVLLVGLPIASFALQNPTLSLFDAFYRAGALVFGGGHVVLPLLQAEVVQPGWTTDDTFLAGYGAAQAVPGPLFTFAAYLGAVIQPGALGLVGATVALIGVFAAGFFVLIGTIPFWDSLRARPTAQAALRGTNAAVVGVLAVAFYDPVWTSAIAGPADILIALAGFAALTFARVQPILVIVGIVGATLLVRIAG